MLATHFGLSAPSSVWAANARRRCAGSRVRAHRDVELGPVQSPESRARRGLLGRHLDELDAPPDELDAPLDEPATPPDALDAQLDTPGAQSDRCQPPVHPWGSPMPGVPPGLGYGYANMQDAGRHPWARGDLAIIRSIIVSVDREARDAYTRGEESCGVLVGPASDPRRVDGIVPMVNRANALHRIDPIAYPRTGRSYFDMDSLKFQAALSAGASEGRPVKVLYHSHVDAGAYFSETDADVARMGQGEPPWDLAYLVTSVVGGEVAGRALFIWDPERRDFAESGFTIVEDGAQNMPTDRRA